MPGRSPGIFRMSWCERAIWQSSDIDDAIRTGFTLIETAEQSVEFYRRLVDSWSQECRDQAIAELSGHDLACWCKAGAPCHVQDVLIPLVGGHSR